MNDLERVIFGGGEAVRPWLTGAEPIRRGPDTQEEIDRCLACPYPECVNCIGRSDRGAADRPGRPRKVGSFEIRSAILDGLRPPQVAVKFGVSKRTVYRALAATNGATE